MPIRKTNIRDSNAIYSFLGQFSEIATSVQHICAFSWWFHGVETGIGFGFTFS